MPKLTEESAEEITNGNHASLTTHNGQTNEPEAEPEAEQPSLPSVAAEQSAPMVTAAAE